MASASSPGRHRHGAARGCRRGTGNGARANADAVLVALADGDRLGIGVRTPVARGEVAVVDPRLVAVRHRPRTARRRSARRPRRAWRGTSGSGVRAALGPRRAARQVNVNASTGLSGPSPCWKRTLPLPSVPTASEPSAPRRKPAPRRRAGIPTVELAPAGTDPDRPFERREGRLARNRDVGAARRPSGRTTPAGRRTATAAFRRARSRVRPSDVDHAGSSTSATGKKCAHGP